MDLGESSDVLCRGRGPGQSPGESREARRQDGDAGNRHPGHEPEVRILHRPRGTCHRHFEGNGSGGQPMSDQVVATDRGTAAKHRAASRRLYEEVFGRGKYDVADELLSADMISHGPGSPPEVGTEPIKRQAALLRGAFPDFKVVLNDQFADGDRVCSRWSSTGTHTSELPLLPGHCQRQEAALRSTKSGSIGIAMERSSSPGSSPTASSCFKSWASSQVRRPRG